MPVYSYKCPECGAGFSVHTSIRSYDPAAKPDCVTCKVGMRRSYDPFPFKMPMPGHLNPTVGGYVSGRKQFVDGLKRASEEATERTGIEHNFQPVDLRDHEALGVTGEGLDATARARQNEGKPPLSIPGVI